MWPEDSRPGAKPTDRSRAPDCFAHGQRATASLYPTSRVGVKMGLFRNLEK